MSINEICEYITKIKNDSRMQGNNKIVLISGDIHRKLELKSRMPSVCRAMYRCMGDNDAILHQTPSGFSSTIKIEYIL